MRIRPLAKRETERVLASGLGLSRLPRGDGSFYLVAWDGRKPLGHAHLAVGDPPELQDVSVLEPYRRRGVATALTRAAEHEAARRGHARLQLAVGIDNRAAQDVYRKLGYIDSGEPPRRVQGIVLIRSGPLEVDDTLLTWEKPIRPAALLVHGGPGMVDYLTPLVEELQPVLDARSYQQGRHLLVADYVAEAVELLAWPRWLVGHSWGGYLALQIAAAAPDRVDGLVLIGTLGAFGDGGMAAAGAELRSRLETPPETLAELWPGWFAGEPPPFPGLQSDVEQHDGTVADLERLGAEGALPAALRSFDKPVLLLHGTYDHIALERPVETAALFPDAELRVLDGVGHFPWLEREGLVREHVVDFLASRSS
jgi:proline iminopeptidase